MRNVYKRLLRQVHCSLFPVGEGSVQSPPRSVENFGSQSVGTVVLPSFLLSTFDVIARYISSMILQIPWQDLLFFSPR